MVMPEGPIPARIMIVGEAPGVDEERSGLPFQGASGQELNRMLHEVGIMRGECFVTNVCRARPPGNNINAFIALKKKDITPQHVALRDKMVLPVVKQGYDLLLKEIAMVQPEVIIALGNVAMWALTGNWSITKWRGSQLKFGDKVTVIPTYHPAAILRQWEWRAVGVADLRRAKKVLTHPPKKPDWDFIISPTYQTVCDVLYGLEIDAASKELWIDFDLETRAGHIACAGLSWSKTEAICIPFMQSGRPDGYWNLEEETQIIWRLRSLLTNPNVKVRWQNGLYDAQYTWRHWHFIPNGAQDTMLSQHTLFVGLPKALDFQASMYCDYYEYWKDDGKEWNTKAMGEAELWRYNCIDCVRTREVGEVELNLVNVLGLQAPHEFQQKFFYRVLGAMNRGVRIDPMARAQVAMEIQEELTKREEFLTEVAGHPLNPRSSIQLQRFFYDDLKLKPILKKTFINNSWVYRPTLDDDAMKKLGDREPFLKPVFNCIADIRTLGVFLKTFILARLDYDGRMRSQIAVAGPYTYRLSSSQNAFGSGMNMQNIPSDKSKSQGKAKARGMEFQLPNVRKLFIPDPGFTMFDMDLDRADLQVVVWECNDADFKIALRLGVDIHLLNAFVLEGKEPPPFEELVETHDKYRDHRGPLALKREFAKIFCHATNYYAQASTISKHLGITVHMADRAQKIWFGAHPGIREWHTRTEEQINRLRYVENRFGYRWHIFGRPDLPEALAWVPQSTVGIVINKAWDQIETAAPEIQINGQVHDSLMGQFPTHLHDWAVNKIKTHGLVTVPYDDPLIIPVGVGTSTKSWGEC